MYVCPLWTNLYQKFQILSIFRYLSPYFYTYNVEIWLNEAGIGIFQPQKNSEE